MSDNFEEEMKKLIADAIEIPLDKLTPDADFFNDLGADSLKAIEIVTSFEKKYRVIVPEKDIPKMRTLNQVLAEAKQLLKK